MGLFEEIAPFEKAGWLEKAVREIQARSHGAPIVIYGAARNGRYLDEVFVKYDAVAASFCDDNERLIGTTVNGKPVRRLRDIPEAHGKQTVVVLGSMSTPETINKMQNKCHNVGLGNVYYNPALFCFYESLATLAPHREALEDVYNRLDDPGSRECFTTILKSRLSGDISGYARVESKEAQYFDPAIIRLLCNEVFVDGGAYIGDTAREFAALAQKAGARYHIYAFEVDDTVFPAVEQEAAADQHITPVKKGLYNRNGEIRFSTQPNGNSGVDATGDTAIDVVRLDNFMGGKAPPTFIKMDIEGSEMNALEGAEQIIRANKPKLAICLYHKPGDLWEIPLFIKNLYPEYRFYMRAYRDLPVEYVLYAIP